MNRAKRAKQTLRDVLAKMLAEMAEEFAWRDRFRDDSLKVMRATGGYASRKSERIKRLRIQQKQGGRRPHE